MCHLPYAPNADSILWSYYSGKSGKTKYIIFPYETKVKYSFETHLLKVHCLGGIDIIDLNNANIYSNNIVMTIDSLIINLKAIFSSRN